MERAGASVGSAGAGRAQVNAGAVRAILHPRDSRLEPITLPVDGAARTLGRHNLRSILEWAQAISVSRSQLSLTFNAATGECTVELLGKAVSVVLRRDKPPQTLSAARDGHIGSASAARATLRHGDVLILYERRTRWSRRRSSSGRLQGRERGRRRQAAAAARWRHLHGRQRQRQQERCTPRPAVESRSLSLLLRPGTPPAAGRAQARHAVAAPHPLPIAPPADHRSHRTPRRRTHSPSHHDDADATMRLAPARRGHCVPRPGCLPALAHLLAACRAPRHALRGPHPPSLTRDGGRDAYPTACVARACERFRCASRRPSCPILPLRPPTAPARLGGSGEGRATTAVPPQTPPVDGRSHWLGGPARRDNSAIGPRAE